MSKFKLNDNAIKFAPWSLTKIDTAKNCGLRFHYKYIDKIKEPEISRPEGRVGSAAHKAIELILTGTDIADAFKRAAVDNKLTTNEVDDLSTMTETIKIFLTRLKKFSDTQGVEKVSIEHKFALDDSLAPTSYYAKNVFMRGVWDAGFLLKDGDFVILDHKTSQPSAEIKKYETQLKIYGLAAKAEFPAIRGVQSGIHYIKDGTIIWDKFASATIITEEFTGWFIDYLNTSVEKIEKTPTKTWACDFCGYKSQCPLFKKQS